MERAAGSFALRTELNSSSQERARIRISSSLFVCVFQLLQLSPLHLVSRSRPAHSRSRCANPSILHFIPFNLFFPVPIGWRRDRSFVPITTDPFFSSRCSSSHFCCLLSPLPLISLRSLTRLSCSQTETIWGANRNQRDRWGHIGVGQSVDQSVSRACLSICVA